MEDDDSRTKIYTRHNTYNDETKLTCEHINITVSTMYRSLGISVRILRGLVSHDFFLVVLLESGKMS